MIKNNMELPNESKNVHVNSKSYGVKEKMFYRGGGGLKMGGG
jgi:hypothetical protein